MTKFILILSLLLSINLFAEEKDEQTCKYNPTQKMTFEAGLHVGIPSGVDARFWFSDEIGAATTLGFDYQGNIVGDLGVLFQFINVYKSKKMNIMFDFGLSFSMGTTKDLKGKKHFMTGLYLPLELALPLKREPITFSVYFAPGTQITPEATWDYRWGMVFNYSFGKAAKIKKHRKCLSGRIGSLGNKVGNLEGKVGNLEGKLGNLEGKYSDLEGENKGLKTKNASLSQTISGLESDKGKLEENLQNLKTEKRELETNLGNIESEKRKLEDQYKNASSSQQKELKKQIEDLKRQKEEAVEAKNRLEQEKKELSEKRDKANYELVKYNKKRCIASGGTFKGKCICPAGRVSRGSECVCAGVNQVYSDRTKKCSCRRGYKKKNGSCSKCKITNHWGTCVSRCSSPEVPWKGRCVCPTSKNFKRSGNKCVCKSGYKEYVSGRCDPAGN